MFLSTRLAPLFFMLVFTFMIPAARVFADSVLPKKAMTEFKLTSPAFQDGGEIPKKYTCDGKDISPPLRWSHVPQGTQSFALIAEDPDAPAKTWIHWVVYNLPPVLDSLPEGIPRLEQLANNELQGMTDFGRVGYGGPCPPQGTHRYFFKLVALDKMLNLGVGASKGQLVKAMQGHVLAEAELVGRYQRS